MSNHAASIVNVHALRPRSKQEPLTEYRPIRLSEADLLRVGVIQREMLRAQGKPKRGVNFAQAARKAIQFYATYLEARK
jgi:hypothetical protein